MIDRLAAAAGMDIPSNAIVIRLGAAISRFIVILTFLLVLLSESRQFRSTGMVFNRVFGTSFFKRKYCFPIVFHADQHPMLGGRLIHGLVQAPE